MASAIGSYGCLALRYTFRIPSRRKPSSQSILIRPLHATALCRADAPKKLNAEPYSFDRSKLDSQDREQYDLLSREEKVQYEESAKAYHDHMNSREVESALNSEVSQALYETSREQPDDEIKLPRFKGGFFAMGEENPRDVGEDEEFEGDDITSLGHGELEQHREMREYARIAAWEMPMLSSAFELHFSHTWSSTNIFI